jgi:hypothetical protein
MKIFLFGTRMFMYMETVDAFDPAVGCGAASTTRSVYVLATRFGCLRVPTAAFQPNFELFVPETT